MRDSSYAQIVINLIKLAISYHLQRLIHFQDFYEPILIKSFARHSNIKLADSQAVDS